MNLIKSSKSLSESRWAVMAVALIGLILGGAILMREPAPASGHDHGEHAGADHEIATPHQHEDAEVSRRVTMSDAQLKQAGVTLAQAGPARIATRLTLPGEVHYNADRTVQVVPRLPGLVEQVLVSAGQTVRKGQVLAVLSSSALADQRAETMAAQQKLALARSTFERERKLWEDKITAEQDYQQARAALIEAEIAERTARQKLAKLGAVAHDTAALTLFELRSPIDGAVTDKRISIGQSVSQDTPLFTVSDLSSVWVEAAVAAKDLPVVQTRQRVRISANAFDAQATGSVNYISPLLGEQSRSAIARSVVPNPKGLWRPGLAVNVEVTAEEVDTPIAVQAAAIQIVNGEQVVFVRHGQQLQARPLSLGRSYGRFVEVLKGLQAGETYAARNSFVVKADQGKAGASHDH